MNQNQNTGGAAFPVPGYAASNGHTSPADVVAGGHGGMTLRDYFAAKAMQAIIAKIPFDTTLANDPDTDKEDATAIGAYSYADAMLKAREERT